MNFTVWIMKNDEKEVRKFSNQEEIELENPDNIFFHSEPVFLINEIPKSKDLSIAQERGVPVVVILSLDKFEDIQERMMWQHMNIPDLHFVCIDWAGDHSNVPFIKNKWREIVKVRHDDVKAEMARKYAIATGGKVPASVKSPSNLPPIFEDIFNHLNKNKGDDDQGGFFMAFSSPPED